MSVFNSRSNIILILGSIVIDNIVKIDNDIVNMVLNILSKGISTVGVSLVVGYIMIKIQKEDNKKKELQDQQQIKNMLQETIISKSFISELSQENKSKIINQCLYKDNYSEQMSKYLLYKISRLQEVNNCTIRSNIVYITTAYKKENKVFLKTEMSYRIYPQNGKYSAIQHDFDKDTGKILEMKIISPNGNTHQVPKNELKTKIESRHFNDKIFTNFVKIPEKYNNTDYLTLKITVEETGFDHWAHLVWMSLYPTETISYKIICQNNLIIKEPMIFDNQKDLYFVQSEKNNKNQVFKYTISCDKWTDPYTGFSLIISEP